MLQPHDARLVQRDRDIPGLALALDPDHIGDWLRGEGYAVRDITSRYVRYKPGTSCLVGFQGLLAGAPVEFHVKAFGNVSQQKFRKSARQGTDLQASNAAALTCADDKLVLRFFPHDAQLPVLARLATHEPRAAFLRHVLPREPSLWHAQLRSLTYKPERRFVGRLTSSDGTNAVIRCYDNLSFAPAYESSKHIGPRGVLTTSRRLGRSHRHRVLIYEWLSGKPLLELLQQPSTAAAAAHATGAALAQLHGQDCKRVVTRTFHNLVQQVAAVARDLADLLPQLAQLADATAGKVAKALDGSSTELQLVHHDFDASQVLVQDRHVGIIDIDKVVYADPAIDFGTFLARLRCSAAGRALSPSQIGTIREALLSGYRSGRGGLPSSARIDAHEAAALLLLSPIPFRYRFADWATHATRLVEAAAGVAASLGQSSAMAARPPVRRTNVGRPPRVPVDDPFDVAADPTMPFLDTALRPEIAATVLQRNLPALVDRYGTFNLERIRVLRHKPGRRCLVAYDVQFPREQTENRMTLIGKVRARQLDRRSFQLQQFLWRSGFDGGSPDLVSVPEPLGVVPQWQMWFQRSVDGTPLTTKLERGPQKPLLARVAAALRKLHGCDVVTDRSHTLGDELDILRRRLGEAAAMLPHQKQRLAAILCGCRRAAAELDAAPAVGIHRDFYPDQVVVSGDRLYLLDFDLFCRADAALDVGNFQAHLWELQLRRRLSAPPRKTLATDFIAAYTQSANTADALRAETLAWLSLARHIYISLTRPHRGHVTEQVLNLCEQRFVEDQSPVHCQKPPA